MFSDSAVTAILFVCAVAGCIPAHITIAATMIVLNMCFMSSLNMLCINVLYVYACFLSSQAYTFNYLVVSLP